MNPAQLLAHFDRIGEALDAIPRLRRFILDLAVWGKLVEQNPRDETAEALLQRVDSEREQLVKAKKIRRQEFLGPIPSDEVPFSIPNNWQWRYLGDVCFLITDGAHHTPKYQELGVPFLSVKDVSRGIIDFSSTRYISEEAHHELCKRCRPELGDILLTKVGTTGIAVTIEDNRQFSIFVSLALLKFSQTNLDRKYLKHLFNSPFVKQQSADNTQGIGNKNLVLRLINRFTIPIPPLAEQHRIVAKVDELMALCDRLEAAQSERESRRDRLVASALHRLNNGADPDTFPDHARFYFNHLPRLTTRPNHIKQLRQTILNLAVRGKLVPQDPTDEPASELLKRIQAEKAHLVKEGKKKKDVELAPIDDEQAPFTLPPSWNWARFPELGIFGRGKSKHRPRNDRTLFDGGTHLLIQTGDVARSKGVIETYTSKYNEIGLAQSFKWPKGTLCITIAANIADSGILSFDACFPDSVVGFIPASEISSVKYFEYFLRTAKVDLLEFAPATAQKNINLEILNSVLIPLPPLAEQHRIVAKVDELMALCNQLETQLTTTQSESHRLLEAILHEALTQKVEEFSL